MIARGTEAATAPSPFSSEQQRRFDEGFEWAVNKYPPERRKSALLAVLHVAQDQLGWLPEPAMAYVGARLETLAGRCQSLVYSCLQEAGLCRVVGNPRLVPQKGFVVGKPAVENARLAWLLLVRIKEIRHVRSLLPVLLRRLRLAACLHVLLRLALPRGPLARSVQTVPSRWR